MTRSLRLLLLTALISLTACGNDPPHDDHGGGHADEHTGEHAGEHADAHADPHGHAGEEPEKGPHNGRLLRKGDIAVELAIVEDGVPPRFRAWLYQDGTLLPPTAGTVEVLLERLGGVTDTHRLVPQDDALQGSGIVYEPHSFDVSVRATVNGTPAAWAYESHEGRVTIPADVAAQAGIRVAAAGPGVIRDEHVVQGLLTPIEGRHAQVVARFPGPIRSVAVGVGDTVRKEQVLATIESNVSLSNYTVTAPFSGTVLARDASPGELAGDAPLFEIADLSRLWVDLHLFGADAQHITPGDPVRVTRLSDGREAETRIERVLPATASASQSTVARAVLQNADGAWRPGAAVRARITVAEQPVALRVPLSALQTFRDWQVVFVRVGDQYEVRPLELGRRDATHVEVLDGLRAGAEIVVEQSYLIKADIEKSGASHDH